MNELTVRYIGIIVQSVAVFAGISTLLGRIYSLTYFDILGIPISDIRLSVADYSVISPDVSIFGVVFSIIVAIPFLFHRQLALPGVSNWGRFWFGSIPLVVGSFLPLYVVLCMSQQSNPNSVLLIVLILVAIALTLFGGAILSFGIAPSPPMNEQAIALLKAATPLLIVMAIGYSVWAAADISSAIASDDARYTLAEAPHATITLDSSESDGILQNCSSGSSTDSLICRFKVILVGDRFVYLKPIDSVPSEEPLYALPIGEIVSIVYASDSNRQ